MIFNMTGGGASLNFQVKTYPSETELKADNPKENTIGVITTTTMTSWVFSVTEPKEPEVGMVWINVGTSSNCEFNALKNNTLQVYPRRAKQYEVGKWVDKTALVYQDGSWVVVATYLFNEGDLCTDITGGWTSDGFTNSSSSYTKVNATIGDTLNLNAGTDMCLCGTVNKVNFGKNDTTLKVTVTEKTGTNGILYISETKDVNNRILNSNLIVGENTVDISNVTGSYYIIFLSSHGNAKLEISSVAY